MKTLTLSICAVLLSTAAFAADDTVSQEGVGTAAIIGGGEEKATDEALSELAESVINAEADADEEE